MPSTTTHISYRLPQIRRAAITLIHFTLICSLLLLLSPHASAAIEKNDLHKVSLQLQWKYQFQFAGFIAAKEKRFYREAGLEVELREYQPGMHIPSEVLEGRTEFASGYATVIRDRMQGKPLLLIANYLKRSPHALVTQPNIYFPAELKDKRVMAEPNELASTNFKQMFKRFDITDEDFTVVPHTFDIEAFEKGDVDAMTVFLTNEVFQLNQKRIPFNILDPSSYGVPFYDGNLFTSDSYARSHPETVAAFLTASNRGWKYALEHSEEIIDLIKERYDTQNKSREHLLFEAREIRRFIQPEAYPLGSIDPEHIRKIQEVFVETGFVDEIIEPESFIFRATPKRALHLTPEEHAFLKSNPRLRILHYPDLPPYTLYKSDGFQGYWIDLLELMFEGLSVELTHDSRRGTTEEYAALLDSGEADILTSVLITPSRRSALAFSDPINRVGYPAIIAKSRSEPLTDLESLRGKRVALVKGHQFETHLTQSGIDYQLVEVISLPEALDAVSYGLADATLMDNAMATWLANEMNLTNLHPTGAARFPEMEEMSAAFAMAHNRPLLQGLMNHLYQQVDPTRIAKLREKWLFQKQEPDKNTRLIRLTDEERHFLREHPLIRLAPDPHFPPIEFFDN